MTMSDTHTILLVDDDPDFLEQLRIRLEGAGHTVLTADGQAAAEEALKETCPDIAIIDLMMEHMDGGFALCYHVKRCCPQTPVIIVTGVTSETGLEFDAATDEERSWVMADAMLAKPIRFEQLDAEMTRLLKAKANGDTARTGS